MNYSKLSDSELISSYLSGQERALQELIHRHQQRIFSYIIVRVKDEELANDIFQDTFVKVIDTLKQGRYNEEGKFIQWTLRIAHNLVIDHFRRLKRMPTMSPNDEFDIFDIIKDGKLSAESVMIKDQIEKDLHKLINQLPEDQREVLELRHFLGMSFKDIAEKTDVSINTALGRMRYALINLRKLMEKNQVNLLMY